MVEVAKLYEEEDSSSDESEDAMDSYPIMLLITYSTDDRVIRFGMFRTQYFEDVYRYFMDQIGSEEGFDSFSMEWPIKNLELAIDDTPASVGMPAGTHEVRMDDVEEEPSEMDDSD